VQKQHERCEIGDFCAGLFHVRRSQPK
jgi:hypothetical protein